MTELNIAVINGSTREGRFSEKPAAWIAELAREKGFSVGEIDLRDYDLPFLGDPRATAEQGAEIGRFSEDVAKYDGYIFTVAEYNHAPTAALKNALDLGKWAKKPAAYVAYGGVGGARALEQVRLVAIELELVSTKSAVHIGWPDYLALAGGEKDFADLSHLGDSADLMLGQLEWLGVALKAARADESLAAAA